MNTAKAPHLERLNAAITGALSFGIAAVGLYWILPFEFPLGVQVSALGALVVGGALSGALSPEWWLALTRDIERTLEREDES